MGLKCSVIIPTLNEAPTIGGLVRSLVANAYPDRELIVVDAGSRDGTVDIAKKEGATVVRERGEKCPANARNLGVSLSSGEVLCFLDGDKKRVNPDFLGKAMIHFGDPKIIGVCAGRELARGSSWIGEWYKGARSSSLTKFFDKKIVKGSLFTFIRKEVFVALGGYPLLGFGEDTVLAANITKYLNAHHQAKIVFEPRSTAYNGFPHSIGGFFKQCVWYGRTTIPYLKKVKLDIVRKAFIFVFPLGYLLSILSIPLLLVSPWFFIPACPYLAKIVFLIYEYIKNRDKFRLLTPLMDFINGIGRFVGLVQYLCRHRSLSRG